MSVTDRSLLDLNIKDNFSDNDTIVSVVSGQASRVKFGSLVSQSLQWSNIRNKPFDSVNSDDFTLSASIAGGSNTLSLNPSITQKVHEHTNKPYLDKISEDNQGKLLYNNSPVATANEWETLLNKPFNSISEEDFIIDESGIVSLNSNIKNQLHTHGNYDVIEKFSLDTDGNLLFDSSPIISDGVDFTSLCEILTTGFQSGISVTADTVNNRINFEVTGIPDIAIDSEGYWTVNGLRGDNPTKAQGENGADGFSPSAVIKQTETGATITVTDKNGETSADISNGSDGLTPTINETTKHWMIGETDTGIVAEGTTTVKTTAVNYFGTLTADNWVGNSSPYTQTVNIAGITAEISPIVDLVLSDTVETGLEEMKQWGYISKAVTNIGTITFSCYKTKPTIGINFKVKVV